MSAPLSSGIVTHSESGPDGEWAVRHVPGGSSVKTYRCPGCDQVIPAGVGHVVTWPAGEYGTVEDRRHWHLPCWNARGRRRPGLRRPR
ncbi:hypothetical protein GCM10009836_64990 [Pseudonocardia ailaonensis]|uniref:ATP/GTP-binding protein n=1 Tax=Pseudonocardia ailaonensis TaxID=367279 RepID=A0ABN2NMD9_9PSEU